jgi:peptidoglycan L-alanyl-D-glutamate endopeptidase CwlK
MSSRRIEDLVPELQEKYWLFDSGMTLYKIDYIVTATRRTKAEQEALYAKGRTTPGPIVTWTLKSKHLLGKAFDIAIIEDGKIDWSTDNPKWEIAGRIGQEVGLTWGGNFTNPDMPHYEVD